MYDRNKQIVDFKEQMVYSFTRRTPSKAISWGSECTYALTHIRISPTQNAFGKTIPETQSQHKINANASIKKVPFTFQFNLFLLRSFFGRFSVSLCARDILGFALIYSIVSNRFDSIWRKGSQRNYLFIKCNREVVAPISALLFFLYFLLFHARQKIMLDSIIRGKSRINSF